MKEELQKQRDELSEEFARNFISDNVTRNAAIIYSFRRGFDAAIEPMLKDIEALQAKLDVAKKALEFYTMKSNYSIVDEGRNYSQEYVCYELDEHTYADKELGTTARHALKEMEQHESK